MVLIYSKNVWNNLVLSHDGVSPMRHIRPFAKALFWLESRDNHAAGTSGNGGAQKRNRLLDSSDSSDDEYVPGKRNPLAATNKLNAFLNPKQAQKDIEENQCLFW